MNTPAHMALSLAALGRRARKGDIWWILGGALLPDLFLYAEHFLGRGTAGLLVDVFNSVPVYAVLLIGALATNRRRLVLLAASALLHIAFDLPFHAEDAHAHFWPITSQPWQSPVSFWDADHHGRLIGLLEAVLTAVCLWVLWSRKKAQRVAAVVLGILYLNAFVHFVGHAFAGSHWALW